MMVYGISLKKCFLHHSQQHFLLTKWHNQKNKKQSTVDGIWEMTFMVSSLRVKVWLWAFGRSPHLGL